MKKLLAAGVCMVVAAELLALLLPERRFVLWTSGILVALVIFGVRQLLVRDAATGAAERDFTDPAATLRRWLSRTETLIGWSDSTRSDWDQHLRPMLARQFEMATGQKKSKDPAAFDATGQLLFGADLWGWVDPDNVERARGSEPGPGRAALDDILRRLEQV